MQKKKIDKIQQPLLIKQSRNKRELSQPEEGHSEKSAINILNGERLSAFPLRSG